MKRCRNSKGPTSSTGHRGTNAPGARAIGKKKMPRSGDIVVTSATAEWRQRESNPRRSSIDAYGLGRGEEVAITEDLT